MQRQWRITMPRAKLKIDLGEGRDIDGYIHAAEPIDNAGDYLRAKCNGVRLGANPLRLRGYCPVCFPELGKLKITDYNQNLPSLDLDGGDDPGNIAGAKQIVRDQIIAQHGRVEDITINTWELPKQPRKATIDKPIDEILRKPHMTFTRRVIK
jgi:hypothetical protein